MNLHDYLSSDGAMSAVELAKAVDCNHDQIRHWRHGYAGRRPGPEYCAAVEKATNGVVTCEELRPDLTWHRVPDRAWPGKRGRPLHDVSRESA